MIRRYAVKGESQALPAAISQVSCRWHMRTKLKFQIKNNKLMRSACRSVVTGMDTSKYGETLKFVYIKYQLILVKSYQRFTKFNYGVTRTIYES